MNESQLADAAVPKTSSRIKEIWILEDDEKYLKVVTRTIFETFGILPKGKEFVQPLYDNLVERNRYPDIFIIDLLNRPTSLRGDTNLKVKGLRLLRNLFGPLYYRYFFKPGANKLMEKLKKRDFKNLTPHDVLCWPWGGLQLLAILADKNLVPFDLKDPQQAQPEIVVNSIVTSAAPEWAVPQVVRDLSQEILPQIDHLLVEKFGRRRAGKPLVGNYEYLTYVVKSGETSGEDQIAVTQVFEDPDTENLFAADVRALMRALQKIITRSSAHPSESHAAVISPANSTED